MMLSGKVSKARLTMANYGKFLTFNIIFNQNLKTVLCRLTKWTKWRYKMEV